MLTNMILLDDKVAEGGSIELPGAPPLIFIKGGKGALFCGYLSLEAAEKLGLAAAIVRGVKNTDEMLLKEIFQWTSQAAALGVRSGMTGKEALRLLL